MFRTTLVTAVMTFGLLASAAQAAEMDVTNIVVRYGDLDLTDAADARTLARRIDYAARRACGVHPRLHVDWPAARARLTEEFETCRSRAVDGALAQLDAPEVRLAYERLSARRSG